MEEYVYVIGGGLAGCEAAYQIAKRGIRVKLYEMKPEKFSPAHSNTNLAEIVCSNSFKSKLHSNACGLLKEELKILNSLLIQCAEETAVPAGQALAVDREKFSELVTQKIEENENIEVIHQEFTGEEIKDTKAFIIIATGPLTTDKLAQKLQTITGEQELNFYDAAAPIVEKESINMDIAFWGDRYGKGDSNYINLPMNQQEYEEFYQSLIQAEVVQLHEFEKREIFEGCMPIEIMAKRGVDTLRYGPLKPVGFIDPRTQKQPYAIVQLRQDNSQGSLFNLVGFQTNLKYGEQKKVFRKIPGLENAEFIKYGVMHRNTYLNSPKLLTNTYQLKGKENIYFAGQITGVEGYVESIASGMTVALNVCNQYWIKKKQKQRVFGKEKIEFPKYTVIGALAEYISSPNEKFQPMNANFGILPPLEKKIRDKKEKYEKIADIAIEELKKYIRE